MKSQDKIIVKNIFGNDIVVEPLTEEQQIQHARDLFECGYASIISLYPNAFNGDVNYLKLFESAITSMENCYPLLISKSTISDEEKASINYKINDARGKYLSIKDRFNSENPRKL